MAVVQIVRSIFELNELTKTDFSGDVGVLTLQECLIEHKVNLSEVTNMFIQTTRNIDHI